MEAIDLFRLPPGFTHQSLWQGWALGSMVSAFAAWNWPVFKAVSGGLALQWSAVARYPSDSFKQCLCSGGCNPDTIGWVANKHGTLFLALLEAGKSKVKALADSVSAFTWQKGQGSVLGGVPFVRTPDLITSHRPHLLTPSHSEISCQHLSLGGNKHSVSSKRKIHHLLVKVGMI